MTPQQAVADSLKDLYTEGHPVGVEVPPGGSSCAKCRYWRDARCAEAKFIEWNGSGTIPVSPDRYCCDFFEASTVRDAVASRIRDLSEAGEQEGEVAAVKGLNKRLLFVVTFMDEQVKVFSANGQHIRTPREAGGEGCLAFTMGMNGYAAREPMYTGADRWCLEDEVVVHDLMSIVDTLATIVHELIERWAMKAFKMSYDKAHEQIANVAEKWARAAMAKKGWGKAA
jgi:hypothetical protein